MDIQANQALLQEVADVVQGRTVVCPGTRLIKCNAGDSKAGTVDPGDGLRWYACEACTGTGRILDPAYADLRRVLVVGCWRNTNRHSNYIAMRPQGTDYLPCEICGLVGYGTGWVVQPTWVALWAKGVDGALAGAVGRVLQEMPAEQWDSGEFGAVMRACSFFSDTAALAALLAALKEVEHGEC